MTNGITNASDYGNKIDVIVGGTGFDTLRVTTGIGATGAANGTVVLNDTNFHNMERVEVGGSVSKDPDESTYQQIRDGHVYFARSSTVSNTATSVGGSAGNSINNVVIDAAGVTKNGLTFEGNANTQRFIGTSRADVFIGNAGADTLTGGAGADKFVFQSIREYARDSSTANTLIAYAPKTTFDKTITTTSGQPTVTLAARDPDILAGRTVTGTGIPAGTTVSSVSADGLTVTLSQNATASGTVTAAFTFAASQKDKSLVSTDADTITDFVTGTDNIVFRVEATTELEDTFDSLAVLTKGNLSTTNVLIGDLSGIVDTAGTATSFIKVDTAAVGGAKVYYDADGSGAGAAVLIATLTGVSTVAASDFRLEAVQGF